jgi:hypothetical protein
MKPVKAEIVTEKGKQYVEVDFPYSPARVKAVKSVTSWRFIGSKGVWRVNLDMPTMRRLREKFGDELELQPKLNEWGHREVESETNLLDLATADDAELQRVPAPLIEGVVRPDGRDFALRPFQRADIAFMAQGSFVNANQPGSGKTAEIICSIMEADLAWGQHLVFAPLTSLELVWQFEIEQLYEAAGLDKPTVFTGDTPASRKRAIKEALEYAEDGLAFWLVLNPAMGAMQKIVRPGYEEFTHADIKKNKMEDEAYEFLFKHPELAEIAWDTMNIDEFHLMGLSNLATQTAQGMNEIANLTDPWMRGATSGTPMGGKPIKLFGAFHFVAPKKFPSKWNWAKQWLTIKTTTHNDRPTRQIEGIAHGREVEFQEYHKQWLIRRLKTETMPGLPPKNRIPVWCKMTKRQAEQYRQFETEAEWRLDDADEEGRLTATNILAEYSRLKQFASAFCEVKKSSIIDKHGMPKIDVIPTTDSGKYDQLVEKLREENVIVSASVEEDDPECALIFSQFNGIVETGITAVLDKHGVPYGIITGNTKSRDRKALGQSFQSQDVSWIEEVDPKKRSKLMEVLLIDGPPRVLVMNTKAGGTTLTLSQANSVHIMDETWNPDDTEQAEDRDHRGDDKTMEKEEVRIYLYRTRNSIEEYIMDVNEDKEWNNKTILNLRERLQKELRGAETSGDVA